MVELHRFFVYNPHIKSDTFLMESIYETGERRFVAVAQIRDEQMRKILSELAELMHRVYEERLKSVILYGSVARGTQTEDSDVDIFHKILYNYEKVLQSISKEQE